MNIFNSFKKETNLINYVIDKKLVVINDGRIKLDDGSDDTSWRLGFEENCNLSIYNNRIIENANSLSDFLGERVLTIDYTDTSVSFNFTKNKKIIVSLKDQDWHGPEVMQLNYNGQIIIWN
jgi:hypothetical protein